MLNAIPPDQDNHFSGFLHSTQRPLRWSLKDRRLCYQIHLQTWQGDQTAHIRLLCFFSLHPPFFPDASVNTIDVVTLFWSVLAAFSANQVQKHVYPVIALDILVKKKKKNPKLMPLPAENPHYKTEMQSLSHSSFVLRGCV